MDPIRRLRRFLDRTPRPPAPSLEEKHAGELHFWRSELQQYVRWAAGELPALYGISAPSSVVPAESEALSALLTWIRDDGDKYLRHLGVPADVFAGTSVLEIGCGPVPYALCFTGCDITGLDPLAGLYQQVGYPLTSYSPRMKYLTAGGEKIPLLDRSVDVVLSVNAIDHVDDFEQTGREIDRVLKTDGTVLLEVHYHPPTHLEPHVLNDSVLAETFKARGVVKVAETPFSDVYPMLPGHDGETLTVWTNRPDIRIPR